jgi:hypothetical protein
MGAIFLLSSVVTNGIVKEMNYVIFKPNINLKKG